MDKHIVLLCSLDTKAREAEFLRKCIEAHGETCIVVNVGYGGPAKADREISASDVAAAASSNIDDVRSLKDTGAASTIMMQGAIICVQKLLREGRQTKSFPPPAWISSFPRSPISSAVSAS